MIALYNLMQQSKSLNQQELKLQTYETYNLDVKTIIDEFQTLKTIIF